MEICINSSLYELARVEFQCSPGILAIAFHHFLCPPPSNLNLSSILRPQFPRPWKFTTHVLGIWQNSLQKISKIKITMSLFIATCSIVAS